MAAFFSGRKLAKWQKQQDRKNGIPTLPNIDNKPKKKKKKKKTKNAFINLLIEKNIDFSCEICGTSDVDILTKHHKMRQSIKKDNSLSNLKSLCREDHDLLEKFYDRILACNIPYALYKKKKELDSHIGRLGSLINKLQHLDNASPSKREYGNIDLGPNFFKRNRQSKIKKLANIKKVVIIQGIENTNKINEVLLKRVDWDILYHSAVEYVKSIRDK